MGRRKSANSAQGIIALLAMMVAVVVFIFTALVYLVKLIIKLTAHKNSMPAMSETGN